MFSLTVPSDPQLLPFSQKRLMQRIYSHKSSPIYRNPNICASDSFLLISHVYLKLFFNFPRSFGCATLLGLFFITHFFSIFLHSQFGISRRKPIFVFRKKIELSVQDFCDLKALILYNIPQTILTSLQCALLMVLLERRIKVLFVDSEC